MAQMYEKRNLDGSKIGFQQTPEGKWVPDPNRAMAIARTFENQLPQELRKHTLLVILHINPYFKRTLSAEECRRLDDTNNVTQQVMEALGFQAVQAAADCGPDDFIDDWHFVASGGRKVAATIADKIRVIEP